MDKQKFYDVIIAGAGPSGMTAALYCAGKGLKVLLTDRNAQAGRKLLVTGNGRCNLTNTEQDMTDYRSEDPELAWRMVRSFHEQKTMEYLRDLGLHLTDRDGYIYPFSNQAATVREAFERALNRERNIRFLPETEVCDLEFLSGKKGKDLSRSLKSRFRVWTRRVKDFPYKASGRDHGEIPYTCSCLLIAVGGLAGEKFGCHGDGFRFAKAAGHSLIPPLPALTALKSPAPFIRKLSGVRCPARITVNEGGKLLASEIGELQWTDYGISGVAVFQLSRYVICALEENRNPELLISFLPGMDAGSLRQLITRTGGPEGERSLKEVLSGIFSKKLAEVLARESRCPEDMRVSMLQEEDWERTAKAILAFPLRISGYMGFDKAQTTRGGVPLSELTDLLESRKKPGLFFSGEVVDVDGTCGGYNLQWAFSSGHRAAEGILLRYLG